MTFALAMDGARLGAGLLFYFGPVVLSLAAHEWAHARTAAWLGDDTARLAGRLTLNPIAHIDLFGTLLLPVALIAAGAPVFGWAKPVPINPARFHPRHALRTGVVVTAAAGPVMNLLLALACALALGIGTRAGLSGAAGVSSLAPRFLRAMIQVNLALGIFNLIPVPPLDGARVLFGLAPRALHRATRHLEQWGPVLLLLLFVTSAGNAAMQYIVYIPYHRLMACLSSMLGVAL